MLKVADKSCGECLFTENRRVSAARKETILRECARKDRHFICHKATLRNQNVVCRGFYEAVGRGEIDRPQLLRVAERLRVVVFVDPNTCEPRPRNEAGKDCMGYGVKRTT